MDTGDEVEERVRGARPAAAGADAEVPRRALLTLLPAGGRFLRA